MESAARTPASSVPLPDPAPIFALLDAFRGSQAMFAACELGACVCMRACVRACMRVFVCVRACACVGVCTCVRLCTHTRVLRHGAHARGHGCCDQGVACLALRRLGRCTRPQTELKREDAFPNVRGRGFWQRASQPAVLPSTSPSHPYHDMMASCLLMALTTDPSRPREPWAHLSNVNLKGILFHVASYAMSGNLIFTAVEIVECMTIDVARHTHWPPLLLRPQLWLLV